jgi:threonine dehydratase
MVEGAGAVGLAALIEEIVPHASGPTIIVATGRNVDPERFISIVSPGADHAVATSHGAG